MTTLEQGQAGKIHAGFARSFAVVLQGSTGHITDVEADISSGTSRCSITGLADAAITESRDRVRAAILNSHEEWPHDRNITISLGPAWLKKHGSAHDAAIAIAVLAAGRRLPLDALADTVFLAELGLDGTLRPIRGVIPSVLAAARGGFRRVFLSSAQALQARMIHGVEVIGVSTLQQLLGVLRGVHPPPPPPPPPLEEPEEEQLCLSDVVGQEEGRFALELAAAGGHHLSLIGPPGSGKTLLAERLPSILPPLTEEETLNATSLHSVAGTLTGTQFLRTPPFQAPHHTATMPALVGGGSGIAQPGAVSLAHAGVLFLDEAPEFSPRVLDALREPLERGEITLARSGGVVQYPARVQLVLAANPCPCGANTDMQCICRPEQRSRYLARLSGPLIDRIDIHMHVPPVSGAAFTVPGEIGEPSAVVARRVQQAREMAAERWQKEAWGINARAPGSVLRTQYRLSENTTSLLDRALHTGELSARGYDRVLRLAWTISDLEGCTSPRSEHIQRALELRLMRRG